MSIVTASLLLVNAQYRVVLSTDKATYGGVRYTIENQYERLTDEGDEAYYPVLNSSKGLLRKLTPSDNRLKAKFVKWPYPGLLIAVRGTAASSEETWYYQIVGKRLVGPVMYLHSGMNGGPVFRKEGSNRTIIFDNYSYYLNFDTHDLPDKFLIYRVGKDGIIRFWKSKPNPGHVRLNDATGL